MWLLVALLLVIPEILSAPFMPTESKSMPNLIEEAERLLVQIDQKLNSFDVKLFSEDASPLGALNLRPAPFPFTPDFAVKHLNIDEHGQVVAEDGIISTADLEFLRNISSSIFVDPDSDAVLRIKQHPNSDEFTLEGIINDQRVSWDLDDSDFSIRHFLHSTNQNRKRRSDGDESTTAAPDHHVDTVDEHRPLIAGRAPPGTTVTANPDLIFLFDFENSKLFNWDERKLTEYASIYINAVNMRFLTIPDPKISFSLAKIYTVATKDMERHYDKARDFMGQHYVAAKLLEAFSYWAFENANVVGKHDILTILTAVPFEGQTAGIAYIEAACWSQKSVAEKRDMSVALIHDEGGIWNSVATVTHELAHSIGVPHDGDGKSGTCPWSEGHMMSYEGWGTLNKLKFSPCSHKAMRDFIVSSGGTCLSPNSRLENKLSSTDPLGKRMSMLELCKKLTKRADAIVQDWDADEQCRMLRCQYSNGNSIATQTIPTLIGDEADCGKGGVGKCREGMCVGYQQKLIVSQEDKDKACKEAMSHPNAVSIDAFDLPADLQCFTLKCKVTMPNGSWSMQPVPVFLGNGVPCNRVGTCKSGKCVMGFG